MASVWQLARGTRRTRVGKRLLTGLLSRGQKNTSNQPINLFSPWQSSRDQDRTQKYPVTTAKQIHRPFFTVGGCTSNAGITATETEILLQHCAPSQMSLFSALRESLTLCVPALTFGEAQILQLDKPLALRRELPTK